MARMPIPPDFVPYDSPPSTPPPAPTVHAARASWDVYFLGMAVHASTRATCPRRHVGCVLVHDRAVIASGYNGSIRGLPHCMSDDVGCLLIHDGEGHSHCERTVHAESNAIAQAARRGAAVDGATAYVTTLPCWVCFRLLANAGVTRIVYGASYQDKAPGLVERTALAAGIELVKLTGVVPVGATTGSSS